MRLRSLGTSQSHATASAPFRTGSAGASPIARQAIRSTSSTVTLSMSRSRLTRIRGTQAPALGDRIRCVPAPTTLPSLGAHGPRPRSRPFDWLVPAPAPAAWGRSGPPELAVQATIAYPPSLAPIRGDAGTVSFAQRAGTGAVRAYLNVTPRQGKERLHAFAAFRVRLLAADDARAVHKVAAAEGLAFQGGQGSCVIDDYVTRVGRHQYREIACLVTGHRSARRADWSHFESELRQAIASFAIS